MEQQSNSGTFKEPIAATTEKGRARILAYGDVAGKSPCFLVVDENGLASWESFNDVRITEPHCLPLTDAQVAAFGDSVDRLKRSHRVATASGR